MLENASVCISLGFNEVGFPVGMRSCDNLLWKLENRAKWDLLSISELMEITHNLATSDLFKW